MTIARAFLRGSATTGGEGSQSGSLRLTACWTFQVEATNCEKGALWTVSPLRRLNSPLVDRTQLYCASPVAVSRLEMPPFAWGRERELVQWHYWLPTRDHADGLQDGGESGHRCRGILFRVSSATVRRFLL